MSVRTRPVRIDFMRPAALHRRSATVAVACAIAAVLAVGTGWWHESTALQRFEDEIAATDAASSPERQLVASTPAQARHEARESAQALAIASRLAIPWDPLFATLEAAAGPDATLTALRPEDNGQRLRLAGEARDLPAVLAYVGRLQRATSLSNVLLASHETNAGGGAVRFTLVADWSPR